MSEHAESKITVQVKQHLQIHRNTKNAVKHLKSSKSEGLAKSNYGQKLFRKDTEKYLTGIFKIFKSNENNPEL